MTSPPRRAWLFQAAPDNPAPAEADILAGLESARWVVTLPGELCAAALEPPAELPADGEVVLAPYAPRAIAALLALLPGRRDVTILSTRDESAEQILAALLGQAPAVAPADRIAAAERLARTAPAEPPWYPVIDPAECSRCGRCVSYCIFGVYQAGPDGAVRVANPLQCKDRCPACARLCPAGAILFPRCEHSAVNGSAKPGPPGDLDELLRGDVLEALRRRGSTPEQTRQVLGHLDLLQARPPEES